MPSLPRHTDSDAYLARMPWLPFIAVKTRITSLEKMAQSAFYGRLA